MWTGASGWSRHDLRLSSVGAGGGRRRFTPTTPGVATLPKLSPTCAAPSLLWFSATVPPNKGLHPTGRGASLRLAPRPAGEPRRVRRAGVMPSGRHTTATPSLRTQPCS